MKILILADVFSPDTIGGAGRVTYHLGEELSGKGYHIHVVTRNTGGKLPSYEQFNPNLSVHRFFSPKKESLSLLFLEIKNSYYQVKKLSQKMRFDIVCIHQSLVSIGPLISGCLKNIPIVYYYHSPWHEEFLIKKGNAWKDLRVIERTAALFMRFAEKRLLLKASRVIVLSQYMRDKITKIHSGLYDHITIIPGGVDLDYFHISENSKSEAKQVKGFPDNKTLFLTIRNLVPRMGIDNLIEAFNESETLRKKSLLLIGGNGILEDRLKSKVTKYMLNDNIYFHGHIPDNNLPEIYHAADFFILPTEKLEGFGLVILEAMACGTPVLGTPIGAIPEVIGPFSNDLLFNGTSSNDIRKKMEDIMQNPERYHFDPENCRKYVKDHFSWKKVADAFEKEVLPLL